jgi:hypothetical protein
MNLLETHALEHRVVLGHHADKFAKLLIAVLHHLDSLAHIQVRVARVCARLDLFVALDNHLIARLLKLLLLSLRPDFFQFLNAIKAIDNRSKHFVRELIFITEWIQVALCSFRDRLFGSI